MTRELLETLILGAIVTSNDYEEARDSVIKMFNFKETMELSKDGLDPMVIFAELIISHK